MSALTSSAVLSTLQVLQSCLSRQPNACAATGVRGGAVHALQQAGHPGSSATEVGGGSLSRLLPVSRTSTFTQPSIHAAAANIDERRVMTIPESHSSCLSHAISQPAWRRHGNELWRDGNVLKVPPPVVHRAKCRTAQGISFSAIFLKFGWREVAFAVCRLLIGKLSDIDRISSHSPPKS